MKYNIEFYEDKTGKSQIFDSMEDLRKRSLKSKDAHVQYKQIMYCIQLLQECGTMLPSNITKKIEGDLWELRPGNNRILYFYYEGGKFVLLHQFRKKTQKTPRREIEQAKSEIRDYLSREDG